MRIARGKFFCFVLFPFSIRMVSIVALCRKTNELLFTVRVRRKRFLCLWLSTVNYLIWDWRHFYRSCWLFFMLFFLAFALELREVMEKLKWLELFTLFVLPRNRYKKFDEQISVKFQHYELGRFFFWVCFLFLLLFLKKKVLISYSQCIIYSKSLAVRSAFPASVSQYDAQFPAECLILQHFSPKRVCEMIVHSLLFGFVPGHRNEDIQIVVFYYYFEQTIIRKKRKSIALLQFESQKLNQNFVFSQSEPSSLLNLPL